LLLLDFARRKIQPRLPRAAAAAAEVSYLHCEKLLCKEASLPSSFNVKKELSPSVKQLFAHTGKSE
jgi:hypothetical protein